MCTRTCIAAMHVPPGGCRAKPSREISRARQCETVTRVRYEGWQFRTTDTRCAHIHTHATCYSEEDPKHIPPGRCEDPDIGMPRASIDTSAPRPRGTNAKSKPQRLPNARDTGEMRVFLGRALPDCRCIWGPGIGIIQAAFMCFPETPFFRRTYWASA